MAQCKQKAAEIGQAKSVRVSHSHAPRSSRADVNGISTSAMISSCPMLSAAETSRLLSLKGTAQWPQAKEQLVLGNLRLVASIARRYDWMDGCSFDDIVSHGVIGLMTALDRFDPKTGLKLSTYATHWILQEIRDGLLYKRSQLKNPAYLEKMVARVKRCRSDLEKEGETNPSDELLAQRTGIPKAKVTKIRHIYKDVVSMNTEIGHADDMQLGDLIPSSVSVEDNALTKITLMDIAESIKKLRPIEQQVIMMRFGFINGTPMTLEECAKETGYTAEGCRYVQETAIRKLQADYLDGRKT